jgi:glycolate oxidase iron-sulfur subunit
MARQLGEWALTQLIPDRERMHLAADVLRLGQRGAIGRLMRSRFAARLLPAFARQGLELTPPLEGRGERAISRLGSALSPGARMTREGGGTLVFHPAGSARTQVTFFTTCVMEVMFASVTREAIRLLVLAGARVEVPAAQGCCGALHAHAGLRHQAKQLASRNVRSLGRSAEFIVTHSAGCGAALREAGHLLHAEPEADEARGFAGKVRDVAEVLAQLGLPGGATPLRSPRDAARPLRVGYHDPCHLAHAQQVRSAPRALLDALPGIERVDLPNSDWCCGSAGIYNLTHAAMADAQLARKLDSIAAVSPDVVVASNPGCLLHMVRGARARGMDVPMVHLVEVLGRAYPA